MESIPSPREAKHNPSRRHILERAVLSVGVLSTTGTALGQQSQAKGRIVSASDSLDWEMSSGRTVSHKLISEHTGDALSIFEEIVPPGEGTPLHIHRTSDEVIHLIEGKLLMNLEGRTTTLLPGARVFIPRGTPHGWRNTGTSSARASYIFNPSHGAKLFEEWRLLGPMRPANMGKIIALTKQYGYELVALTWE